VEKKKSGNRKEVIRKSLPLFGWGKKKRIPFFTKNEKS